MNTEINLKTTSKTLLLTTAFLLAAEVFGESTAFDFSTLQPRDRIWMSRTDGSNTRAFGDIDGDGYHDVVTFLTGWRFTVEPFEIERIAEDSIVIQYGSPFRRGVINQQVAPGFPSVNETHLAEFNHDAEMPTGGSLIAPLEFWYKTKLGAAIACDDFDNDGVDDIVFMANDTDPARYGTDLCIYFGQANVRGELINFEDKNDCPDLARIALDDPQFGEAIETWPGDLSEAVSPWRRADICTGDFDADTFVDIAVVMYRDWHTPEIVILYGKEEIRGTTRSMSDGATTRVTKVLCEHRGPKNNLDQNGSDPWGPKLASGDFNGDGIDDLAIGDNRVSKGGYEYSTKLNGDHNPLDRPGVVYLLAGSKESLPAFVDLTRPVPESGETVFTGISSFHNGNCIGRSVSLGDANQDGYDDFIFGARSQNVAYDWALLYQFMGSPAWPGIPYGNGYLVDLDPETAPIGAWGETRIGWHDAPCEGTYDGYATWGDVSGDGRDDIAQDAGTLLYWCGNSSRVVETPAIPPGERAYPAAFLNLKQYGNTYFDFLNWDHVKEYARQDIDGDGEIDVGVATGGGNLEAIYIAFGSQSAPVATAVERYADGLTAMRGFGGRMSPVLRTHVGFEDGKGGAVTATLNKSGKGVQNLPVNYIGPADCYWHLETDRVNYTLANVSFRYIESDLFSLPSESLVLLTAPSLEGPWVPAEEQHLDTFAHRATSRTSQLGYFTLAYFDDTGGPIVLDITCEDSPGHDSEAIMTVTFSHSVTGVENADFAITAPSTQSASILSVEGSGKVYKVRVNVGTGIGAGRFEVVDDDSIRDVADRPLGGPGVGNGAVEQETCTEVFDPVFVKNIARFYPSPNALPRVAYTVQFSAPVLGLDASDFAVDTQSLSGVHIENILGSGDTYQVWINTGSGSGTLSLRLVDDDSVTDLGGGPLGGPGLGNGNSGSDPYSILREEVDTTPPAVQTITRASVSPTSAVSVDYYVEFTEHVIGVDVSDFDIVTTGGISGAAITGIHGDTLVAIVTISTGTGDGTNLLRLLDNDSITDLAGNPLGGAGAGNGSVLNGPVYTIYKSDPNEIPPSVTSITRLDPSPTEAFTVRYRVRFDENVTGVDVDDFRTTSDGLIGSSVTNVSGSADDYTVTVNTGNGAGTLRLDVRDNDSILDADQNPLGGTGSDNGHFTNGQIYQIVRDEDMSVRSFKNSADVERGGKVNVKWTSGDVGKNVRIELWRNGQRVAVLVKKTKNDGAQGVVIPGGASVGGGYTIRIVSTSNPEHHTDMKKPFTVQ